MGEKSKDETFARSVSPMSYVTKNSPPVFIVHGDADPTVPYQQSVDLHKKLLEAGVKTEFIRWKAACMASLKKKKTTKSTKPFFISFWESFKIEKKSCYIVLLFL
jgi:acetyl esterase/lipase